MKHSSKTSYFLVGQVFSWSIHQGLEGETLCSLTEGDVDVLVGDTSARCQGQRTVWRQVLGAIETCRFPLSLGRKIYKVAELQLTGVGETSLTIGWGKALLGRKSSFKWERVGESWRWSWRSWWKTWKLGGGKNTADDAEAVNTFEQKIFAHFVSHNYNLKQVQSRIQMVVTDWEVQWIAKCQLDR